MGKKISHFVHAATANNAQCVPVACVFVCCTVLSAFSHLRSFAVTAFGACEYAHTLKSEKMTMKKKTNNQTK